MVVVEAEPGVVAAEGVEGVVDEVEAKTMGLWVGGEGVVEEVGAKTTGLQVGDAFPWMERHQHCL